MTSIQHDPLNSAWTNDWVALSCLRGYLQQYLCHLMVL